MRKYEFRGKRTSTGKMVHGSLVAIGSFPIRIMVESKKGVCLYDVDPETVGQYVMEATTGESIFEGDRIRMLGDFWPEASRHRLDLDGYVTYSGTSFGIWCAGQFYGIDTTPWDIIELI